MWSYVSHRNQAGCAKIAARHLLPTFFAPRLHTTARTIASFTSSGFSSLTDVLSAVRAAVGSVVGDSSSLAFLTLRAAGASAVRSLSNRRLPACSLRSRYDFDGRPPRASSRSVSFRPISRRRPITSCVFSTACLFCAGALWRPLSSVLFRPTRKRITRRRSMSAGV